MRSRTRKSYLRHGRSGHGGALQRKSMHDAASVEISRPISPVHRWRQRGSLHTPPVAAYALDLTARCQPRAGPHTSARTPSPGTADTRRASRAPKAKPSVRFGATSPPLIPAPAVPRLPPGPSPVARTVPHSLLPASTQPRPRRLLVALALSDTCRRRTIRRAQPPSWPPSFRARLL